MRVGMTMMAHYLAVLPAGLRVTDLGEDWRQQVKSFQEHHLNQWITTPPELRDRSRHQLD
jgi:hypothetical protein